jgi:hypothetical protein
MSEKYATFADPGQASLLSSHLAQRLQSFLAPLTRQLNSRVDARLLRTVFAVLIAIISFSRLSSSASWGLFSCHLIKPRPLYFSQASSNIQCSPIYSLFIL